MDWFHFDHGVQQVSGVVSASDFPHKSRVAPSSRLMCRLTLRGPPPALARSIRPPLAMLLLLLLLLMMPMMLPLVLLALPVLLPAPLAPQSPTRHHLTLALYTTHGQQRSLGCGIP